MNRLLKSKPTVPQEGSRQVFRKKLSFAVAGIACASAAATFAIVTSSGGAAVTDTTPAASEMSVFSSVREAADGLPQNLASWADGLEAGALNSGSPASEQPGSAVTSESRLLLSGQGSPQADLYALPTSSGEACYVLSLGPATCVDVFSGMNAVGWTVSDPDSVGSGAPLMVFGIAPDSVSNVDVIVDGSAHTATLKNNGFFYQLANSSDLPSSITAIKVSYTDGSSNTIQLHLLDPHPALSAG